MDLKYCITSLLINVCAVQICWWVRRIQLSATKQLGIRGPSVKMEGSLLPSTVFVQITLWETDKLACAVS